MTKQADSYVRTLFRQYQCSVPQKRMTEEQFFSSDKFRSYARSLVVALLGRSCDIEISYEPDSGKTASTNGRVIRLNALNPVAKCYPAIEQKVLVAVGMIVHECAHLLYLDFETANIAVDTMQNGAFFGGIAGKLTAAEQQIWEEMQTALREEKNRRHFIQLYHWLDNLVADVHDEACICRDFGGIVRPSLQMTPYYFKTMQTSYEVLCQNNSNALSTLTQLLLDQTFCGEILMENPEQVEKEDIFCKFKEVFSLLETAWSKDSYTERCPYINRALLVVWPFLQEEFEKSPEQEWISDLLSIGEWSASDADVLTETKNSHPIQTGQKQKELSQEEAINILGGIANTLEQRMQQKDMEKAVEQVLKTEVERQIESTSQTSPHKGLLPRLSRTDEVSEDDIARYNEIMDKVRPFSKQMQKRVGRILEELRQGYTEHHKRFGRTVEARESFRRDGRFFASKKQPQDLPDMAIAVLVDQSGSMYGERLRMAMEAAILLDDFASGLGIPILIAGHNTANGADTVMYLHALFDRAGKTDSYRLAQMRADENNRDGMALNIIADMLAKRPEEMKLLIVISDGQPSAVCYRGQAARDDIKHIVAALKVKGIQTFAAAVGDDKEQIREIYGEGFLDVSNLATLPQTMVRLISKRLI